MTARLQKDGPTVADVHVPNAGGNTAERRVATRRSAGRTGGRRKGETLGVVARTVATLKALFDESKHPRKPEGTPGGGQFTASADTVLGTKLAGPGGSNPGGVYRGTDGVVRYVKFYDDPAQAAGEHLANAIYRGAGLGVPESVLFPLKNGTVAYASTMLPQGIPRLAQAGLTKAHANAVLDGFAADVLTANWDAVGLVHDNALVHPTGAITRVDNGGTFLMRAQAGRKPPQLLEQVTELKGFASPGINPAYAKVFAAAGMTTEAMKPRVRDQLARLRAYRDQQGGWEAVVAQHAGAASPGDRAVMLRMLRARDRQLGDWSGLTDLNKAAVVALLKAVVFDEAGHPRWPAGTEQGKGGQFAPKAAYGWSTPYLQEAGMDVVGSVSVPLSTAQGNTAQQFNAQLQKVITALNSSQPQKALEAVPYSSAYNSNAAKYNKLLAQANVLAAMEASLQESSAGLPLPKLPGLVGLGAEVQADYLSHVTTITKVAAQHVGSNPAHAIAQLQQMSLPTAPEMKGPNGVVLSLSSLNSAVDNYRASAIAWLETQATKQGIKASKASLAYGTPTPSALTAAVAAQGVKAAPLPKPPAPNTSKFTAEQQALFTSKVNTLFAAASHADPAKALAALGAVPAYSSAVQAYKSQLTAHLEAQIAAVPMAPVAVGHVVGKFRVVQESLVQPPPTALPWSPFPVREKTVLLQEAHAFRSKLPADEKSALSHYQGSGYGGFNSIRDKAKGLAAFSPEQQARFRSLDRAVMASPTTADMKVVRKVTLSSSNGFPGSMTQVAAKLQTLVGSVVEDPGYGSSSRGGTSWHGNAHFHYNVPQGTHAVYMGSNASYANEDEVLLHRNLRFLVKKVLLKDSTVHVYADVLPPHQQTSRPTGKQ